MQNILFTTLIMFVLLIFIINIIKLTKFNFINKYINILITFINRISFSNILVKIPIKRYSAYFICLLLLNTVIYLYAKNSVAAYKKNFYTKLNSELFINPNSLKLSNLEQVVINKNDPIIYDYICKYKDKYNSEVVDVLIAQQFNINPYQKPPVICLRDIARIKHLVELGADINAFDNKGWSLLHYITEQPGNINSLEFNSLLNINGINVNIKSNDDGRTPLHNAAFYGYVDIIKALLSHGAKNSITNMSGQTPLDWAISQKQNEAIQLLNK